MSATGENAGRRLPSARERRFLAASRVAHLATADRQGVPHVLPVCFMLAGDTIYIAIDDKPKRQSDTPLKRLRNIAENPAVAVVVDRYDEAWERLGWVMLRGHADILTDGTEHDAAQSLLRSRYHQLEPMQIAHRPVMALRVQRVTSWGDLSVPDNEAVSEGSA
jgi:PPOX class probable F420-dependent enzyme